MVLKKIIRKGDTTSHGGTVLEGVDSYPIFGQPIACEGHMVECPLCKGIFPIADGVKGNQFMVNRLLLKARGQPVVPNS